MKKFSKCIRNVKKLMRKVGWNLKKQLIINRNFIHQSYSLALFIENPRNIFELIQSAYLSSVLFIYLFTNSLYCEKLEW